MGRIFFSYKLSESLPAQGDCRQQVLRVGMSEHLTSIHRVTADSRFFVCQQFRNKKQVVFKNHNRGDSALLFNLVNLGVNHGIAHALGEIFHIPHGRANALVLPYVIEFNADMAREGAKHSNDAAKKYQKMARIVGLPAPTPKVGVANLIAEIQRLLKYITQCRL